MVWGAYKSHKHLSCQNITNGILTLTVMLPSILLIQYMNQQCIDKINDENMLKSYTTLNEFKDNMVSIMNSQDTGSICKTYLGNPILTVNILFFLNVSILFWIIGLIQHTFWLIDPYWTILPVLIGHFYRQHPLADPNPSLQANLAMILVYVWAFRLTYSYFRRENFKFGEREDWRYTKMAEDFGNWWYILSFFAVGIAQQPLLVGVSLPLCAVHIPTSSASTTDILSNDYMNYIFFILCISAILIAESSDTTLQTFMMENKKRVENGRKKIPILRNGLWKYSRHPNYFGEISFWTLYSSFAFLNGSGWMIIGTVMNTACLLTVTSMTESKMLREWPKERVQLYKQYQQEVSMLVPWPCVSSSKKSNID